jgi:hypothetical protein
LVFTALGLVLEGLHGFKVGAYLNVSNESRRLMWTLAHAHGTLLSLVNVIFGLSLRIVPELRAGSQRFISACLIGASILLPGGFFLGGVVLYGGDPGIGSFVITVGATLLLMAIFLIARTTSAIGPGEGTGRSGPARSKRDARRGA